MSKFKVAVLICATVLIAACSQATDTSPNNSQKTAKTVESALILTLNDAKGTFDVRSLRGMGSSASAAYSANGQVLDTIGVSPVVLVNGGAAVMASCSLAVDTAFGYGYIYTPLYKGSGSPAFGGTKTFSLAGNNSEQINGFSTTMYVPQEIVMTAPATYMANASTGSGFTVTWNQDNSNTEPVYIGLVYLGAESHAENGSLSSTDVWKLISTTDDGSYTVSSSDLTGMPVGGILKISIGRGNSKTVTNGGQTYLINAYTIAGGRLRLTN